MSIVTGRNGRQTGTEFKITPQAAELSIKSLCTPFYIKLEPVPILIKTGGTDYMVGAFQAATSPTLYSHDWDTNPKTGVAWTWDDVDALEAILTISRCSSYQYTMCYQMYLIIDYTEAPQGWANIAKFSGVTATDLAKVLGIAVADCSKISGVAV